MGDLDPTLLVKLTDEDWRKLELWKVRGCPVIDWCGPIDDIGIVVEEAEAALAYRDGVARGLTTQQREWTLELQAGSADDPLGNGHKRTLYNLRSKRVATRGRRRWSLTPFGRAVLCVLEAD